MNNDLNLIPVSKGSFGRIYRFKNNPNVVMKKSSFLLEQKEEVNNQVFTYQTLHITNIREIIFANYFKRYLEDLPHNLCLPYQIQIKTDMHMYQYLPALGINLVEWRSMYFNVLSPVKFQFWSFAFIFQIANTLSYLEPYFCHGDLSPRNIMICEHKHVFSSHIIDFGASSTLFHNYGGPSCNQFTISDLGTNKKKMYFP